MGMRVIWVVFGAAVAYIMVAVAIPAVIVVLRNRGVEVTDSQTAAVTTIGAVWAAGLGAWLGWRQVRKLEAHRAE